MSAWQGAWSEAPVRLDRGFFASRSSGGVLLLICSRTKLARMTLLLVYAGLALGVSFFCSLLESVLLSVTPSYVAELRERGVRRAEALDQLKAHIDRPLAAILGLNTVANTVGAAGVGAQAQALWGSETLAVASGVLTLLILTFSEIVPKTLGAMYWPRLAPWAAGVLRWLVPMLLPFAWLAHGIGAVLARLRGTRERTASGVSREEILALAALGGRQGVMDEQEVGMLRNLLVAMRAKRVGDIMTPQTVLYALPADATVGEVHEEVADRPFSRIPLWESGGERLVGYVLKDDVLEEAAADRFGVALRSLKQPLSMVPESLPVARLLRRFLAQRAPLAVVVDEYGNIAGIVTMEDVIEELFGREILDEADEQRDLRGEAERQWKLRRVRIDALSVSDEASGDRVSEPVTGSEERRG